MGENVIRKALMWCALIMAITAAVSMAGMYVWTDENGVKHFTNTQPPEEDHDVKNEGELPSSPQPPASSHSSSSYESDFSYPSLPSLPSLPGNQSSSSYSRDTSDQDRERDAEMCEKYRKRLEKYLREGVMGINPITGKKSKMTGEDAEQVIQNTRDIVEMYCN